MQLVPAPPFFLVRPRCLVATEGVASSSPVTGGTVMTNTDISEPDDGKTRDASPEEPTGSNIEVKRVKKPSKRVFGLDWTI